MVGSSSGTPHHREGWEKAVGLTLALTSGLFIGSSFIFKKKGLLDTNALGHAPGQGHAYLKSGFWWSGLILMGIGEMANFGAYAFIPAILVTPLGALSVVISAVLSSIFLKERLDFSGKVGCVQCVLGAIIIVLNAPENNATDTVSDFFSYVITPLFLVYTCIVFGTIFYLIRYLAPKYGDKHPIVYISICSLVGSYLVLSAQGFGSSVVYTLQNTQDSSKNQFLVWPIYPLIGFVIFTVFMQINYLNKALNLFSTAIVTPVYYVFFTGATLLTSAVLFRGFKHITIIAGISIMIGFLVIVGGVSLLFQFSLSQQRRSDFNSLRPSVIGEDSPTRSSLTALRKSCNNHDDEEVEILDDDSPLKSSNLNVGESEHIIVEMKPVEMKPRDSSSINPVSSSSASASNSGSKGNYNVGGSSSSSNNNTAANPFSKNKFQLIPMNPAKMKHSPKPSFDNAINLSTKGIANAGYISIVTPPTPQQILNTLSSTGVDGSSSSSNRASSSSNNNLSGGGEGLSRSGSSESNTTPRKRTLKPEEVEMQDLDELVPEKEILLLKDDQDSNNTNTNTTTTTSGIWRR